MTTAIPLFILVYLVPFLIPMSMPGWSSLIGLCLVVIAAGLWELQPFIEGRGHVDTLTLMMPAALLAPGFIGGVFTRTLTLMYEPRGQPALVVLAQIIGVAVVPLMTGLLFYAHFSTA